jgi:hypothetical protein
MGPKTFLKSSLPGEGAGFFATAVPVVFFSVGTCTSFGLQLVRMEQASRWRGVEGSQGVRSVTVIAAFASTDEPFDSRLARPKKDHAPRCPRIHPPLLAPRDSQGLCAGSSLRLFGQPIQKPSLKMPSTPRPWSRPAQAPPKNQFTS